METNLTKVGLIQHNFVGELHWKFTGKLEYQYPKPSKPNSFGALDYRQVTWLLLCTWSSHTIILLQI
jgi:hypothetical protein